MKKMMQHITERMNEISSQKAAAQNQKPTPYSKSARLKIGNARIHFEKLQNEYKSFIGREPFRVNKEEDQTTGQIYYRLSITEYVPEEWSCIIGDVVHNLRAALDHLAWQSVIVGGGTPDKDTAFPFAEKSANFPANLNRRLKGASNNAIQLVSDLCPYSDGDPLLWSLHQLDVIDKHKILLPVGAAYKSFIIQPIMKAPWQSEPITVPAISIKPADRQFPLINGAILFGMTKQVGESESMKDPQFQFELVFGEDQVINSESAIEVLSNMEKYITEVADKFDRVVFS